jgi:hypothetical protein
LTTASGTGTLSVGVFAITREQVMKEDRKAISRITLAAVVAAAFLAACLPSASKGTMPPPGPDGRVNASFAPDFIAIAGRDGSIVGYVPKEAMLAPAVGGPVDAQEPVYGEDLYTVVGQMVPGKGFVPTGVDPASIPDIPVRTAPSSQPARIGSGQVVLYVRNDSAVQAWLAIQEGSQFAQGGGFWGGMIGVGCFAMSAGSGLVLLDHPANDAGASADRVIYTRGLEAEPPELWIVVGADGTIVEGRGIPTWWSGGPPDC